VSDGVVTPIAVGETDVVVTTEDGSFKDTCKVIVLPTGIEDANGNRARIYPNPASDRLHIDAGVLQIARIEVRDLSGGLCLEFAGMPESIDISALPNGVYLVYIEHLAGIEVHRIVKTK
ncbi:MAG: T9SS type A sorting domain-containing protein, partial [Ignavibacteria bacterium]|nr:T9SS type A sorting domain-containing protein [Ignavibacteria bacterium]